ncbi:MAG: hypothetical protein L3J56_07625, partial [Bacteroidales bacterium]|nr:hypothetical protein [Bacteroidales bacterium]
IIVHNTDFEGYVESLFEQIKGFVTAKVLEEQNRINYIARNFSPKVLSRLNAENMKLSLFKEQLNSEAVRFVEKQSNKLHYYLGKLPNTTQFIIRLQQQNLGRYHEKLTYRLQTQFNRNKRRLDYFEKTMKHLDPVNLLKKGYSITRYKGKVLTDTKIIKNGDEVETLLFQGLFTSKVIKKEN